MDFLAFLFLTSVTMALNSLFPTPISSTASRTSLASVTPRLEAKAANFLRVHVFLSPETEGRDPTTCLKRIRARSSGPRSEVTSTASAFMDSHRRRKFALPVSGFSDSRRHFSLRSSIPFGPSRGNLGKRKILPLFRKMDFSLTAASENCQFTLVSESPRNRISLGQKRSNSRDNSRTRKSPSAKP